MLTPDQTHGLQSDIFQIESSGPHGFVVVDRGNQYCFISSSLLEMKSPLSLQQLHENDSGAGMKKKTTFLSQLTAPAPVPEGRVREWAKGSEANNLFLSHLRAEPTLPPQLPNIG